MTGRKRNAMTSALREMEGIQWRQVGEHGLQSFLLPKPAKIKMESPESFTFWTFGTRAHYVAHLGLKLGDAPASAS